MQTLTNIPPEPANVLYVTLNGHATNYSVPANATIESVVSNLTLRLHQAAYTNATRIRATAHGDRVELQSFDSAKAGSQVSLSVSNSAGGASGLKTFVAASGTNFLDTIAYGLQNFAVTGAVQSGNILQLSLTKTNGAAVSISVTNAPGNTNTTQFIKMLVDAGPQTAWRRKTSSPTTQSSPPSPALSSTCGRAPLGGRLPASKRF